MSDRMTPIPFPALMEWILSEHEKGSVFGVRKPFAANGKNRLDLFSEHLETPFGPAAGPQTQLSQNLVAAYYAGARFFELKTVQTLDGEDLPVSKPCILAEDECYNVEWSTELRVREAFEEYVKAWYAIKLLAKEYSLGAPDGFMFNMSVGYNFEGISSKKIDDFIEGLKDASRDPIFAECRAWAKKNLSRFQNVDEKYIDGISPHVCTSGTLSTLHGCPPQEIERIASYLIEKKGLHTFVKCNPTLLGYDFCRKTLDELGFSYVSFDEFHFNDDLQYVDAIPMFKRLSEKAAANGVSFGLKLSNTFPVAITRSELPGTEMYMSGRSLYPLTIEMARRITEEFDGHMRISFSGGIDAFNISELFGAGVWPITMATTLLKPGGYQRFTQMAELMQSRTYKPFSGVSVGKVAYLADRARSDARQKKAEKPAPARKLSDKVPLTHCFTSPCTHGCPIHQDIPAYVELVGRGEYEKALSVIVEKNPLPSVTGKICPHRCMDKCTRTFMDESVHIRAAKRAAVQHGFDAFIKTVKPGKSTGKRVAVVGGGPGGMAAAFFLARQGAEVTLFEKRDKLGGVVRYIIPRMRISDFCIDRDAQLVEKMGVDVRLNTVAPSIAELKKQGYDAIVLAVGAWAHTNVALKSGKATPVFDFLERSKAGEDVSLGAYPVIVGGGNTAMDAARVAKRTPGVAKSVLCYRRDKRNMPADEEELQLAEAEGVSFCPLRAPVSLENGELVCEIMKLGDADASGRRAPVPTGEFERIPCTCLIAAVGEKIDAKAFAEEGLLLTDRGRPVLDPRTLSTNQPDVYVVGDAKGGPATVVEAIADARRAADAIVGPYAYELPEGTASNADCYLKQGVLRVYDCAEKEVDRCLHCGKICECCVTVCPNRANVAIDVPGEDMPEIIHVDRMCNECGNCKVFCPYDSAPYLDKLTLFDTEKEFSQSRNQGFLLLGDGTWKVRLSGEVKLVVPGRGQIDPAIERLIATVARDYTYLF